MSARYAVAVRGDDGGAPGGRAPGDRAEDPGSELEAVPQELVEGGDAVVVEAAGDRAEDRQFVRREAGVFAVAGQLPAHLPQRVLTAPALELVDRHRPGEVEHVDLLQLGGGAELRRHHVEGEVDMRDHGGVPLADARRLHDDEVEAGGLAGRDGLVETAGQLVARVRGWRRTGNRRGRPPAPARPPASAPRAALGRHRRTAPAAESRGAWLAVDGVHADAVPEQRPASLAAGRVHRQHRHAQLVLLVDPEPADQLVSERGLPRSRPCR